MSKRAINRSRGKIDDSAPTTSRMDVKKGECMLGCEGEFDGHLLEMCCAIV